MARASRFLLFVVSVLVGSASAGLSGGIAAQAQTAKWLIQKPSPKIITHIPLRPTQEGGLYRLMFFGKDDHYFKVSQSKSSSGAAEIQVSHVEMRQALPDTSAVVLWGRDLDSDGFADAWFFYGESGVIEAVELPSQSQDGWDAAAKVLVKHVDFTNRWVLAVALDKVVSSLSFARSSQKRFDDDLRVRQIDLREAEIRAGRIARVNPAAPGLSRTYSVISDGWAEMSQDIDAQLQYRIWVNAGTDILLDLSALAGVRGLTNGLSWFGGRRTGAEVGETLYRRYATGVLRETKRVSSLGTRAATATAEFARLESRQQLQLTLRAMEAGTQVARQATITGIRGLGAVARAGISNSGYIIASQTTQVFAELYGRRDTIFQGDALTIAKNIVTNEEMIQNISYMTAETFLLTSVSTYMTSIPKRMIVGGIIATSNSAIMNFLIKGESDMGRIGLDTTWEVFIGNGQVQLDLETAKLMRRIAEKSSPQLKHLGTVFAIADQAAGYLGYNCITQAYGRMGSGQQPGGSFSEKVCDRAVQMLANGVRNSGMVLDIFQPAQ